MKSKIHGGRRDESPIEVRYAVADVSGKPDSIVLFSDFIDGSWTAPTDVLRDSIEHERRLCVAYVTIPVAATRDDLISELIWTVKDFATMFLPRLAENARDLVP